MTYADRVLAVVLAGWALLLVGTVRMLLPSTVVVHAQQQTTAQVGPLAPFSHVTLAPGATTALAIPPTVINDGNGAARHCFATVETQSVRYWLDGTAPTSSAGHLVAAGGRIDLNSGRQITGFQVIATTMTASVPITCER